MRLSLLPMPDTWLCGAAPGRGCCVRRLLNESVRREAESAGERNGRCLPAQMVSLAVMPDRMKHSKSRKPRSQGSVTTWSTTAAEGDRGTNQGRPENLGFDSSGQRGRSARPRNVAAREDKRGNAGRGRLHSRMVSRPARAGRALCCVVAGATASPEKGPVSLLATSPACSSPRPYRPAVSSIPGSPRMAAAGKSAAPACSGAMRCSNARHCRSASSPPMRLQTRDNAVNKLYSSCTQSLDAN